MATAALQGFELRVLGVDEASFMGFSGDPKMKKLLGMQALFQNTTLQSQFGLHDCNVLIFADAGDVLYLGGLDEVENRWNALIATHGEGFVALRLIWSERARPPSLPALRGPRLHLPWESLQLNYHGCQ